MTRQQRLEKLHEKALATIVEVANHMTPEEKEAFRLQLIALRAELGLTPPTGFASDPAPCAAASCDAPCPQR